MEKQFQKCVTVLKYLNLSKFDGSRIGNRIKIIDYDTNRLKKSIDRMLIID